MKKIIIILLVLLGLVIVAGAVLFFSLNNVARQALTTVGKKATKTELTVEGISLSIFAGHGEVKGLTIANPEGYDKDHAFKLQRVFVRLEPKTLFADTLIINEIIIEGPAVFIEQGLRGNNINTIRRNVTEFLDSMAPEKEEPAPDEPSRQVIVEKLTIRDGRVDLSSALTGGKGVSLNFRPVEMTDIGKGDQVATLGTVFAEVLDAIGKAAVEAAAGSGELLQKGRELLLEGIPSTEGLGKGAKEAAGGLMESFQKSGQGLFNRRSTEEQEEEAP